MSKRNKKKGLFGMFGGQPPETSQRSPVTAGREPTVPTRSEPPRWGATTGAPAASAPQRNERNLFQMVLDGSPREEVFVPGGMIARSSRIADGKTVLHLSGGDAAAAPIGHTGGLSIRLPDSMEVAASGKRVRVSVIARAPLGHAAEFSVAYSTNEVGNSGWRKFTAGKQFEAKSFEFDVPPMKEGRGDFVGILPGPGSAVEIETLKVEVISRT
jgi:hypothetical protein